MEYALIRQLVQNIKAQGLPMDIISAQHAGYWTAGELEAFRRYCAEYGVYSLASGKYPERNKAA